MIEHRVTIVVAFGRQRGAIAGCAFAVRVIAVGVIAEPAHLLAQFGVRNHACVPLS